MRLFKFTLITLACLLSYFAHAQGDNAYVQIGFENTASYTFTVRTPSPLQFQPRERRWLTVRVGEEVKFMKLLKKYPLFVVTPEMNNTVIDISSTARLRNKGDVETIIYLRAPRNKVISSTPPKKEATPPPSPKKEVVVPPPPPPPNTSETVERPRLPDDEEEDEIFTIVQDMPRFPGCEEMADSGEKKKCAEKKMLEFIYKSIKYPTLAKENGIEGMVVISYVVEKDGSVTNAKVLRGPGSGCNNEALRVVNSMPKWIPGKQRNQPVRVQFNLPIGFNLEGGGGGSKSKKNTSNSTKSSSSNSQSNSSWKYYERGVTTRGSYGIINHHPALRSLIAEHKKIAVVPINVTITDKKLTKNKKNTPEAIAQKEKQFQTDFQRSFYERLAWMQQRSILKVEVQDVATTNKLLSENGIENMDDLLQQEHSKIADILGVDAVFSADVDILQMMSKGGAFVLGTVLNNESITTDRSKVTLALYDGYSDARIWEVQQRFDNNTPFWKTEKLIQMMLKDELDRYFPYHVRFK